MSQIYKYCDGYTMKDVTVDLAAGSCNILDQYNTAVYRVTTQSKIITITLSEAIPVSLIVRYKYHHHEEVDNVIAYDDDVISTFTMPAGTTHKDFEVTCSIIKVPLSSERLSLPDGN